MPEGSFVILLPTDSDNRLLGSYFKDSKPQGFDLTDNLILRLKLDHMKREYNFLKLREYSIASYYLQFTGSLGRKALGIIIGLLLSEEDDPEGFRPQLENAAKEIKDLDIFNLPQGRFENKLKIIYSDHLENLTDLLNPEMIKSRVINKTKDMLSKGKKERKLAQELLEMIEDGLHKKIAKYYRNAEKALKSRDYDKAAKNYNKAASEAEELKEDDLASTLKERAKLSSKIPDLTKKRDNLVEEARNYLKKENFHEAYKHYKQASELSKELLQAEKEEEYRLKAKALSDFYQVDQRFKKSK
ncbi:MAG: hypothetical protein BAJALOKI2v1_390039 [Promethearchaeota archaeon]|nr:MAG: hypothetical protein BAJALOKI2v1_390039 [Candidatus Lokiarchaeota archaeon]